MAFAVNTIQNSWYNSDERNKLGNEYWQLKEQLNKLEATLDDDIPDEEWECRFQEASDFRDALQLPYLRCFAAQFPKTRNEWFSKVIEGYDPDKWYQLTEKQYRAFHKYAGHEDCDTWRNGRSYCRVGDYLVTLCWKNANRSIKKEYIGR